MRDSKEMIVNHTQATLSFRCKYFTTYGQHIRVVGNIEELGSWEPSKAIVMTTNKDIYPYWESTQTITLPVGTEIFYKYVVYDPNSSSYIWEILPQLNRQILISFPGQYVLNDEEGSMKSEVNRISGPNVEQERIGGKDEGQVENVNGPQPVVGTEIYNSLCYDTNQLNTNDLNETFSFCLTQKITTEDRIIIASAHLPFEIEKNSDNSYKICTTDENLIYSILYEMKEKSVCKVVWVGMLKNFRKFSETELVSIYDFLKEKGVYMIKVGEADYKNYWIYMNKILGSVFIENTVDIYNTYFLNYEEYFNAYHSVNRLFGDVIYKILQEHDLVMINDVHLMLIPNSLMQKNTNARVGIYFHMAFPSSDVIKTFPYHQEFLKSILLCDVIGFHVFQFARNFLTVLKRIFGIFFDIKFGGFITLNYLGRYIIVRIMHAGIDIDYVRSIVNKQEFIAHAAKYKLLFDGKFAMVSVDIPNETSGLLLKMEAYKKFLEKYPEIRDRVILVQIIKSDDIEDTGMELMEHVNKLVNEIISRFGSNVIHISEVVDYSIYERFALFSVANALFFLQSREGNCMFVNEYIALQKLLTKEDLKYGIVISENIGVSSAIKGAMRVNTYNIHSISNGIEKVYFMGEEERKVKFKKDLEYVEQNTILSWIKNFFIDLKRTSLNQTSTKIGLGMGLNYRMMKLNSNFQHLSKLNSLQSYKTSEHRLIFLNYEGTLQPSEGVKSPELLAPSLRLLKLLTALSSDPKNQIFIVSGRDKNSLNEWFSSVPNIGLAAEHGFFYKTPPNMRKDDECPYEYNHLYQIKDWSWKDSALKILQGFTEKTEGSSIVMKETMLSWFYRDCDVYFGHIQANEINTHLQNIFEGCKLDIVNGKGYVEIKPRNVNKGFFISHIIKNSFMEQGGPDFILAIGEETSDEEMFKYLNSVQNQLTYLNEKIKVYTCTIGRKPSNAKCFLNEVNEVLEYLESLNQSCNSNFERSKSKAKSTKVNCMKDLKKSLDFDIDNK